MKAYKRLSTDDTYGSIVSEWGIGASEELLVHGPMVDGALIWAKRQRNVIIVIDLPQRVSSLAAAMVICRRLFHNNAYVYDTYDTSI